MTNCNFSPVVQSFQKRQFKLYKTSRIASWTTGFSKSILLFLQIVYVLKVHGWPVHTSKHKRPRISSTIMVGDSVKLMRGWCQETELNGSVSVVCDWVRHHVWFPRHDLLVATVLCLQEHSTRTKTPSAPIGHITEILSAPKKRRPGYIFEFDLSNAWYSAADRNSLSWVTSPLYFSYVFFWQCTEFDLRKSSVLRLFVMITTIVLTYAMGQVNVVSYAKYFLFNLHIIHRNACVGFLHNLLPQNCDTSTQSCVK